MAETILTRRQLNRATLARQLLLERATLPIPAAVAQVAGLQAQVPNPPYIGLWTRLHNVQRDDLTRSLEQRQVVRATMMRATLHLTTADDYLRLRPTLQPALTRTVGQRAKGVDIERLVAATRTYFEQQPRTFPQVRTLLAMLAPDYNVDALAYIIRTHLPLVQVPPGGVWGIGGSPTYALAASWLGQPLDPTAGLRFLVHRYLAAFGPASIKDVQAWSGLTGLRDPLKAFQAELRTFRDEQGTELLDLPDLPLPPAATPAPPRFIPEYDNLVLAHSDRSRIIPNAYRAHIFLSAARVRATFLIDGVVHGTWKIERTPDTATLVIEPFAPIPDPDRTALLAEGERLLRFVEDRAPAFALRIAPIQ